MDNIENDVKSIVRFVEVMYEPKKIDVFKYGSHPPYVFHIILTFNEISDKYITNPEYHNVERLKEIMLSREIKTYIQNYLGIKTDGLQPNQNFFSPEERHPIKIIVRS